MFRGVWLWGRILWGMEKGWEWFFDWSLVIAKNEVRSQCCSSSSPLWAQSTHPHLGTQQLSVHGPGEQRCIVLVRLWWLWQSVKKALLKWTQGYILKSPWNHFTTCREELLQGFSQVSGATPARLRMCLSPLNPIKNATATTNYDFVSIYIFSDGHMSVINPELNWRSAGFAAAAGTRSECSWYPCISWYRWVSWDCRLNN